jgi:hypothetical protein
MAQHKTIVERVTELEKAFPQLIDALNDSMKRRTDPIVKSLNALVEMMGRDVVLAKMGELQEKQQTEEMEAKKSQLESAVAQGRLVKKDAIGQEALLVARESDATGKMIHPGRFHVNFAEIAPQFQEKLLGKPVGATVEIPGGSGVFEVLEIYEMAPAQVPAAIESPASN